MPIQYEGGETCLRKAEVLMLVIKDSNMVWKDKDETSPRCYEFNTSVRKPYLDVEITSKCVVMSR